MSLKKLLFLPLAITFSLNTFASVDLSGTGRVRFVEKNNQDFDSKVADKGSETGMRFRLNINATKGKKWNVFMQPQFTKTMGQPDFKPSTTTTNKKKTTSGALYDTSVTAHQMFVDYKANEYFNLKLGRTEINLGDQLLVGAVGYSDISRSFDGFIYSGKGLLSGTNSVFALKLNESTKNLDGNVYGIYHSQSLGSIKEFDLYWLNVDDRTVSSITTNFNTFGIRLKSKINKFDYRIELNSQKGKDVNVNINEQQYDLEFGYKLGFLGARLGIEYFYASEKFNQLFPTGHKWLGAADMFSRKNINGIVVHYSMKLAQKTKLLTQYHMFSRTKTSSNAYKLNSTAYTGTANTQKAIANELDIAIKHVLDDGLGMKVGYSFVTPGSYLKALDPTYKNNMSYLYAEMTATF